EMARRILLQKSKGPSALSGEASAPPGGVVVTVAPDRNAGGFPMNARAGLRPAAAFEVGQALLDGDQAVRQPDSVVDFIQPAGDRGEGGRRAGESLADVVAQVADVALGRH